MPAKRATEGATPPPTAAPILVFTRKLSASRERIFQAWASARSVARWWGPDGFTVARCEVEFRTGGAIRIDMRGPDGTIYPMSGVFREVAPFERIVLAGQALGADGEPMFESENALTFTEEAGVTTLRFEATVLWAKPEAAPYLQGMKPGWEQQLGRLEAAVRGD